MSNYTIKIGTVSMTSVIGLLMCTLISMPVDAASRARRSADTTTQTVPTVQTVQEKQLAVTVQGDGTVTSYPAGVNCPADCSESYQRTRYVTLTASAGPDSRFLGWQGACAGTEPTCRVTLRGSSDVIALFDEPFGDDPVPDGEDDLPETISIRLSWPAFNVQ